MTVHSLVSAGLLDLLPGDPYRLLIRCDGSAGLIDGLEKALYPKRRSDRSEFLIEPDSFLS